MPSAVVNQGPETLLGDGKNHVHDRGVLHDYEKQVSNHWKIRGFVFLHHEIENFYNRKIIT